MNDEQSLDPEDWESFRAVMHRATDEVVDYLRSVRDTPAWRPPPSYVAQSLPQGGESEEEVFRALAEEMLPYRLGNIHPRFWTRVGGTGTPMGVLAEMMASAANSNAAGQASSATQIETQVIDWFKEIMGFPSEASGLLTVGASTANLIGIAVARHRAFPHARLAGSFGERPTIYCSEEAHASIDRAASILGVGLEQVRHVPADDEYRMRPDALRALITNDRERGFTPFCIVGTAGTVATGSSDDLSSLADIAHREGLWFHVDGAFGSLVRISPSLRQAVHGIERADSVGFDLHKWLHMPYDVGCALVRDPALHKATFSYETSYLAVTERGPASGTARFYELGIDLSRGSRAVKVWASMKHFGIERYARSIEQNVAQARHLAALVSREPRLTLMAPVPLNIVCFRFSKSLSEDEHRALNEQVVVGIQESGLAIAGTVDVKGRNAIRVAITNHRTRREDLDLFISSLLAACPH